MMCDTTSIDLFVVGSLLSIRANGLFLAVVLIVRRINRMKHILLVDSVSLYFSVNTFHVKTLIQLIWFNESVRAFVLLLFQL